MDEKNTWKNEVLKSLDAMQKASPPPLLFEKIQKELHSQQKEQFTLRQIRWIAAAAAVLVLINVLGVRSIQKQAQGETVNAMFESNPNKVISNYNLYN